MDELEEKRGLGGKPQALQVERRGPDWNRERVGDRLARWLRARGKHPCLRIESPILHLLGEAHGAREVAFDAREEDERATAPRALDALLADQLAQRAPDGDQTAAVTLGEFALGGKPVASLPFTLAVERCAEVEIDLVVQGDRTLLELVARHITSPGRGVVDARIDDKVISNLSSDRHRPSPIGVSLEDRWAPRSR